NELGQRAGSYQYKVHGQASQNLTSSQYALSYP
ncbi:unnamed protein product, partial [marine sediment metagenome]